MPVKSKARVFDPQYKIEPGGRPSEGQRHADAFSFAVDVEMLTKGKSIDLGDMSGPQVGSPFDSDAMGEERTKITYEKGGK